MVRLTDGTFFAEHQEETIFMNLPNDSYYSFDSYNTKIWNCIYNSAEKEDAIKKVAAMLSNSEADSLEIVDEILDGLTELGLIELTENGNLTNSSIAVTPATTILERADIANTKVSIANTLKALKLYFSYKTILKTRNLYGALNSLPRVNQASNKLNQDESIRIAKTARKSLGIVRSFFSRGEPDCLPKSLTISHLLREKNLAAEICIGIQKFPFEAHAWVELDRVVVSTSDSERLKKYFVIARL